MTTEDSNPLRQLAARCGILDGYHDIWGEYHPTGDETRRAILSAMGLQVDSDSRIAAELQARSAERECETDRKAKIDGPERGFWPPVLLEEGRLWGINFALYGVCSARNWGVGDFADLLSAVEWAAGLGADFIGLLPLHHLFNTPPYGISPYFPSSRLFLNPIHIAVDRLPEAQQSSVRRLLESVDIQTRLSEVRTSPQVDHARVWQLKWEVLAAAYQEFRHDTARNAAFAVWRQERGQALEEFATFCALRDHHLDRHGHPLPWPQWPVPYRRADTFAVAEFRDQHSGQVSFHAWLQWLAEEQLRQVQARCQACGMRIGLYLDTALGVDPCGADAWVYQDVLALSASAGAPPDPFSLLGQRWGVPPAIPERHRATGYRFLRQSLAYNAARAGALRIDHVLAFWRLFWVPEGLSPAEGAYVSERPSELLALARQVSREQQCLIVGEDLGTVPPEVREDLRESGLFSYRVMIFEKDANGFFHPPREYAAQALVSVTTHDLPTLDGFWLGRDLEVKRSLDRYPSDESRDHDNEVRRWDRFRLQEILQSEGLLHADREPTFEVTTEDLEDLAVAVHAFLARTPAHLMLVSADDLFGEMEMQNLPGTLTEHPNWQRKGRQPLETWPTLERPQRIAAAIHAEGRGRKPGDSFFP